MAESRPSILVITELFPSPQIPYLGSFVASQLEALAERYQVVAIIPHVVSALPAVVQRSEGGVQIYRLRVFSPRLFFAQRLHRPPADRAWYQHKKILQGSIMALAQRLHSRRRFALVHGHEVFVGDEAARVGRQLGLPSVVTAHSLFYYLRNIRGGAAMSLVMQNLRQATRLIAVSRMTAASYQRAGLSRPFEIIPNSLPPWVNRSVRPLPEPWQALARGRLVVLGVGFFNPVKRFDRLIEAAALLLPRYRDRFVVLLVGMGPEQQRYQALIRQRGLAQHVHIVGPVPPAQMMAYFSACDLLVHPSVVESFSMVCLEAMAMGKPFICVEGIGITEYITPGREALVVPPDDLPALVDAIDQLLSAPARCQAMGQAGHQTAKKFQWQNMAPKISAVYDRLIATR